MAESDRHRDQLIDLLDPLRERYRDRPDVYVTGNLFLYYKQGDPTAKVAPDLMVVRGVPNRRRPSYLLWEEKKVPDLVIEVTSEGTKYEDLYAKRELYEELGVKEYYLFDPLGEYLPEQRLGYHRAGRRLVAVKPKPRGGGLSSAVLGLDLVIVEGRLRLYDAKARRLLPLYADLEAARAQESAARAQAERALAQEAEQRRRLEAEVARLRAAMEKSKGPSRPRPRPRRPLP